MENEQLSLFHLPVSEEKKAKSRRTQNTVPSDNAEQLSIFELEEKTGVMPVFYVRLWDPKGLPLSISETDYVKCKNESIEEQERVRNKLIEKCKRLIEKGIIGWAEVVTSGKMPKVFGKSGLVRKHYPESPLTKEDLVNSMHPLQNELLKMENELKPVLEDLQAIGDNPLDGRTREGQNERDIRLPILEEQRDVLQQNIENIRTEIENAGRTPQERLEHRLQQIEGELEGIRAEGDTNTILRREREGEKGLLGDLHSRRYYLHQERDELRQQLSELNQ